MSWSFSLKSLVLPVLLAVSASSFAQTDPIEANWFDQDKNAKIKIYKAKDGKFYGKIAWLREPERDGKTKVDERNPDESKRSRPILGLVILRGFEKDGNEYEDGTIYDPKTGKTYSANMKLNGNKLDVRGYIGISMIGRTTTWHKAD